MAKFLRLQQWAINYWVLEFVSWAISASLLVGVVVTLLLHQNRPLPDWPLGITINALVSLLSAVSTSALLVVIEAILGQDRWSSFATVPGPLSRFEAYDDASRGPLGALAFLFTTRPKIVSLAAFAVVASVAVGPFIQQVIFIEFSDIVVDTASLLSRVDYPNLEFTDSFESPLAYSNIPGLIVAGFYQGLYFSGNLTDPYVRNSIQQQPICETGNCTYPDFDSLAVCSACTNITDYLIPQSKLNGSDWTWSWALPNNFSTSESSSVLTNLVTSTGGMYHPLTLQAGLPIVNITAIQPCVKDNSEPCDAIAQECMLHWCLNRYRSKVVGGVYYEDILDTVKYGRTTNPDLLENDTYVFQANYSNSEYFNASNASSQNFTVSKWGSAALTDLLAQELSIDVRYYDGGGGIRAFQEAAKASAYSTFPNYPLDMAPFFEALSLSMTSNIRSNRYDEAGSRVVSGQATKSVPIVRVRWAWISLPVGLEVVTLILLCYIIAQTSRQQLPTWKGSVLATLFTGAMIHDRLAETTHERLAEMKWVAEKVKIGRKEIFSEE